MGAIKFITVKKETTSAGTSVPGEKPVDNVDKLTPPPSPIESSGGEVRKPKRRRGRPPGRKRSTESKNVPAGVVPLDILPPVAGLETESEKDSSTDEKKSTRGRKKKSSNWNEDTLASNIQGWHEMLNVFIPGCAIGETQAKMLAKNLIAVKEAWDIQISEKVTSLIGLGAAVAIVEFPVMKNIQYIRLQKRAKAKAIKEAQKTQGHVVEMAKAPAVVSATPPSQTSNTIMNDSGEVYAIG